MNKHLHRIVFNASRGLRMVVQETAKSTGRGARKATSGGAGASSAAVSVAAIAAALMSAPLHAQIVADPGAPGGQRPTVLGAPNGVPLVNIQTPSAAGVSRNTYSQFDVQRNGAILNNSRTNVQTQLGGYVQGNPWLATGSARVILNEVNSANPSQLRGYVEVAGPRTEVIIANPAGIQVDGGGFINVNRATLTTGTPQFNAQGGLDSFVVRGGSVSIDGAGLDASKTDYAAIMARAVQVNAGLWANELKVVTGANQVSADSSQATPTTGSGAAPSFALDVAALGGMYAGKITLVGTEAGVGVRNAGHIGAGAGGLVVTAAGRLENTGTLEGAKVELTSAADIDNRGGTIRQTGTRDIAITAPVLSNTNGGVIGAEPVAAADPAAGTPGTDTGATGTSTGATPATGSTAGTATTTAGFTEIAPLQPAAATGPGDITAAGSVLNDGGRIYAGGEIALNTPRIDNAGGSLSVGTMTVTGDRFSNAGGTLNVSRDFSANVGNFDNSGGALHAGDLRIQTSGDLVNRDGTLTGNGDVDLTVGGNLNNTAGTIVGNEAVQITAGGLTNQGGKIHAAGSANLTISVNALLTNRSKGEIESGGNTTINAGVLDNDAGRITAVGDLRVTALGAASNRAGTLAANRNATLDAASFDNGSGSVNAVGGDLAVTTAGATVNQGGKLQASGAALLANGGLDNTDGQVIGGRVAIDTQSNTFTNVRGTLAATATTVDIQSGALDNTAGLIQSKAALTIDTHGQALTNAHAAGYADGEGGITSAGAITLRTGAVDNSAGFVGAAGALMASSGEFINGNGGVVVSRTAVDVDTRGALYDNRGGQTLSTGDLVIAGGRIDNGAGLIRSGETATLRASSVDNANTLGTDQGIEARNLSLTADSLTNTLGAIRIDADATILSAGTVDNSAGLISAKGALQIADPQTGTATPKTLEIVNTGGTLTAGKRLVLDAAGFSGDGTVVSDKDLSIALSKDVVNNGAVSAAGTLSYVTTGTFTNNSKLYATQTLTVGGADVLNNATGEMSAGQKTAVTASGTLTNRGLIDGVDTQVNAGTLDNLGTGRIYGDRISLLVTGTLNNGAETVNGVTSAASIASRDTLHIGAKVINNSGHAQIFSVGNAAIGGALDGNRQAIGQAATLTNSAATIDIGGNLRLTVDQVDNLNPSIRTEQVAGPTKKFLEYAPAGSNDRLSGGTYDRRSSSKDQTYAYYTTSDGRRIQAKEWTIWDYERNTAITQVVAGSSDPGQILVGGDLNYSGNALRNQASKIVIGGALTGNTGALKNEGLDGVETTTDHGTATHSYTERKWYSGSRRNRRFETVTSYDPAVPDRTFVLDEYTYEQGQKPATGNAPGALVAGTVAANTSAAGQVNGGNRAGVITEVATGVDGVVRTSLGSNGSVPTASLFRTASGGHYLVETDPRFAGYRNWLSSDYLLNALGQDPNNIQKRLGDGFYEQKLIREQIAQLTGYRYLDGFESDETQYTALMNAGVTFAQAYGLRPGIGLSAAQMAQLTSDIVWLVEQTVTLADGSTQRVLVPQVYVRVTPGDIDGGGALLSANELRITNAPGTGNVTNTGTLAGRTLVAITADNVNNLGGRIVGGSVGLNARNDLNNIGGSIDARNAAVLTAGHDINIRTTTSSQTGAQGSRTGIDRVAGVYVTNPGGTLIASAGNDVNLVGAILSNTGAGSQTLVSAANDINLGTVKTARSEDITWDAKNYRRSGDSQEIGSQIAGAGDITLQASRDVNARAATVAAEGALGVLAGRNVTIDAGRSTQGLDEASYTKSSDMLSSTATTRRDTYRSDTATGSSFGGKSVAVSAGNDIRITGSEVIADERLALAAANNITIEASMQTASESHFLDEKKKGVFGSGGIGFTIGSQQQSTDQQTGSTRAAASTVGSVGGDVVIVAGNAYRQTGSDVLAPAGDVTILAKKVDIVEARETSRTDTEQKQRTGGLTIAITAPIVSAVQSLGGTAQAVADTGSKRMKALGAASMALEAKGIADAVMQSPSQAMGVNLAISIDGSKSQSNSVETSDSARGSSVAAGGNVTIAALGGGQDSNLLIRGSDIDAGKQAVLMADNRIDILAAQNDWAQHSTNKASAASIGVSFGTSGFLVNASASASKGRSDGTETSYTNSHVNAGERVTLASGGDTTIRGGVITAETVRADIGGNLTIESLQDRAKSDSKQQSAGGSLSVGAGVWSASVSMSSAKAKGDYASVTEQSGIKAGDGGFDVSVKGHTDLKGGVISSTQAAIDQGRNSFQTASLTTSDIENRDAYKASGATLGVGLSGGSDKNGNALPTRTGGSAGTGKASDSQASVTRSGISGVAGDETVRTGTDTTHALTKTWNTDTLVKDVQAQAQITQGFGSNASKAVGDYAGGKAAELRREGKEEEAKAWDEGGANRSLAHALIGGLTGGMQGAAGAAFAALAAPTISDLTKDLPDSVKGAVGAGLAAGLGASVGGSGGATAGFNEDLNNRQLHYAEKDRIRATANGDKAKEERLTQAACYAVKCWAQYPEGSELYKANYVSALDASGLSSELAWVANEKKTGLFEYTAFQRGTDAIAATTGMASGTFNGQPVSSLAGNRSPCGQSADCAAGVPYGRNGDQYGPPDYVSLQGSFYVASGGLSINLRNGDIFGQWSAGRGYPAYSLLPNLTLVAGNIYGANGANDVNEFLGGGSAQVGAYVPAIPVAPWIGFGGGINHSYGGKTAVEAGISIPPSIGVSPAGYGFQLKKTEK